VGSRQLILGFLISVFANAFSHAAVLFSDLFDRTDGLITNEYAFWNPSDARAFRSPDWEMGSGSFFVSGGTGWTGVPNAGFVDRTSSNATNSAIFRLNTKRSDYQDVSVSFSLLNQGLSSTSVTPAVAWDGMHIWLHYQSETSLYYASINRRDGTSIIKKKVPGGPSNGGTYYDLSPFVSHPVPYGQWTNVKATVQTHPDNTVTIALYENGQLIVQATDDGSIGGPPITGGGRVGLRGDNANLKFENFVVESLGGPAPTAFKPVIRGFRFQ
jgi:hypothetical protein